MPVYTWPTSVPLIQTVNLPLPLLAVGPNTVAVTWPAPFSATGYTVSALIEAGSAALGSISPRLAAGTAGVLGCTIVVTNGLLVSLAAGAVLHVTAIGT